MVRLQHYVFVIRIIVRYSIFKRLLKKYENGTATAAERYIVEVWYRSFDEDQLDHIPGIAGSEETEATRQRILNRMMLPSQELSPVEPKEESWFRRSWLQMAASLILISAVSLFFYLSRKEQVASEALAGLQQDQVYSTKPKEIKRIYLKDNTSILLNANSSLRLVKGFGKHDRRVRLRGEAHFEVSRDTLRPFIIDAGDLHVKVLGTVFNVRAYTGLNDMSVNVNSGKVQVSNKDRQLALLTKGRGLTFHRNSGAFELGEMVPAMTTGWTEGRIVLQKASFEELAQNMKNIYGLTLRTSDKKVRSFKYNVTLRSRQPEGEALEILMKILNKKYIQEDPHGIKIY